MGIPSLLDDYKKYLAIEKDVTRDYVDLSHMRFVAPASVLPALLLAKSNSIEKYKAHNEETDHHLKKILGISQGNSNLLPLLTVNLDSSESKNLSLDKLNNDIRDLLFPGSSFQGGINYSNYGGTKTFPYIIQEIINNVKQHSNAKRVFSYSQRYPNADFIDVGILDDGDTIPGKYEQVKDNFDNENGLDLYDVQNDCEAIFRSLNGISTKEDFRRSRSIRLSVSEEDILNSGDISLGINSSIRLATEGLGGSFLIASRGGICHLANGKAKFINAQYDPIDGTLVCIRFERKFLTVEDYEMIAHNFGQIPDDEGKYKLASKKLDFL